MALHPLPQVVNLQSGKAEQGGFFCNVCDCVMKDHASYLDHINGRKHQKNLGMSMRVERSTVDQVRRVYEMCVCVCVCILIFPPR